MSNKDRQLGMHLPITRRDFVNGVGIALTGSMFAGHPAWADAASGPAAPLDPYPPRRTGMRGSHPGSFEVAHQMRDARAWDLGAAIDSNESYDLVVVGGGISGLSAAHFFLKRMGGNARVLVLDNHDDFGGHAKRNEFEYNGRLMALNGGTLNIESPLRYNAPAQELLRDIGIDLPRYEAANAKNHTLYDSLGLREAYFFDRETWGHDRLLVGSPEEGSGFTAKFLGQSPLTEAAKRDLQRLYDPHQPDYLPGSSDADKKLQLARMSYRDYLLKVAKVDAVLVVVFRAGDGRMVLRRTGCGAGLIRVERRPARLRRPRSTASAPGHAGGSAGRTTRSATNGRRRRRNSFSRRQRHGRPPSGPLSAFPTRFPEARWKMSAPQESTTHCWTGKTNGHASA